MKIRREIIAIKKNQSCAELYDKRNRENSGNHKDILFRNLQSSTLETLKHGGIS